MPPLAKGDPALDHRVIYQTIQNRAADFITVLTFKGVTENNEFQRCPNAEKCDYSGNAAKTDGGVKNMQNGITLERPQRQTGDWIDET